MQNWLSVFRLRGSHNFAKLRIIEIQVDFSKYLNQRSTLVAFGFVEILEYVSYSSYSLGLYKIQFVLLCFDFACIAVFMAH